jgi:large subunit ribosomal protein L15
MPLIRRLPKRGFNNTEFKITYRPVNLLDLNAFEDGNTVDLQAFKQAGLANGSHHGIKILGSGELKKKLIVKAAAFSAKAKAAIEALGGVAELVS